MKKNKKAKKPVAKKKPAKAKKASKPKKAAAKKAPAKKPAAKASFSAGLPTVIPYLAVKDAKAAYELYQKAFGMKGYMRMPPEGPMVFHAHLLHEGGSVMLGPENPAKNSRSPKGLGGTAVTISLYVRDVDKAHARAAEAGLKTMMAPEDQFWGDRMSMLEDPDGHWWMLMTHVRDVSPAEMMKAMGGAEAHEHKEEHHGHGAPHSHEHSHGAETHSHEHAHGPEGHSHEHAHDHSHDAHGQSHGDGHSHGNGHSH